MHNCHKVEKQFVDLVFDDMDADGKRRLLAEIKGCANCSDQYHSLSDTLFIFERTTEAALPPEGYWPRYNATLRERLLRAPAQSTVEQKPARAPFWQRLLVAKFQVPAPVAAALVIALIISSALALRSRPAGQTMLAPSSQAAESVRLVQVPFAQEKIVTRTVYVEKKRDGERALRPLLPTVASARDVLDMNIAGDRHEDDTGFFTRANLKGFQPTDDMKIRVLKRNNENDK
jgi:hypothetical protein